jgi:hypothetical protein
MNEAESVVAVAGDDGQTAVTFPSSLRAPNRRNERNVHLPPLRRGSGNRRLVRLLKPSATDSATESSTTSNETDEDEQSSGNSMEDLNLDDIELDAANSEKSDSLTKPIATINCKSCFAPVSPVSTAGSKRNSNSFSSILTSNRFSQEAILEEDTQSSSGNSFISTTTVTQINDNKWQEIQTYKGIIFTNCITSHLDWI